MSLRRPLGRSLALLGLTAALLVAPPAYPSDPNPQTLSSKTLPGYRGDENSQLRLKLEFGPAALVLKGPGGRGRVVELRFVVRF